MKVLSTYNDGKLIVQLDGELDHHTARKTMMTIEKLIDDYMPRDCIMDLARLTFMDSAGIALFLRVFRIMNEMKGRVWAENIHKQPSRIIEAAGIDRIIRFSAKK